jgi:hypothetical protein
MELSFWVTACAGVTAKDRISFPSPEKRTFSVIVHDDLATVVIRRVIFHDVPRNAKKGSAKPDLSDLETNVRETDKNHLQNKLPYWDSPNCGAMQNRIEVRAKHAIHQKKQG